MESKVSQLPWLLLFSSTCVLLVSCHAISNEDRKPYIVYMGDRPKGDISLSALHENMLQEVVGSGASEFLLRSYHRSFNGFAAKLTKSERDIVAGMEGVVSVFPSQMKKLHTTRSWDFMRFPVNVKRSAGESDVIVGMLDTGIWPEAASFSDKGFGPPPSKWKGTCQGNNNFTCNNKIIGARYYHSYGPIDLRLGEIPSPRDSEGHGTHTASTVAGSIVDQASLLGLGTGTARGGTPSARVAVYKICWTFGCSEADILAAFDDAIADGVDIISLSVGGHPTDYFEDSIAIGAFHSMKNGILTSNSAGNEGPEPESVSNCSPWSLSVAASTIDRKFVTQVKLGNGASYEGVSINTFDPRNAMYPVIYAGDAPNSSKHFQDPRFCDRGSLNRTLVEGKIVFCDRFNHGEGPLTAGAIGSIMQDEYYKDYASSFPLPVTYLDTVDGEAVLKYLKSTGNPIATIFKSVEAKDKLAPYVFSFSSRGPNPITKDIVKPDLTAPGVEILAAWSEATTVTGIDGDTRVVPYNIISGTSMSCPHASAAAAYVKSFYPTWSPAALKSALMTTASIMTTSDNGDAEFAYGSGHINPIKATDPGLVYDAAEIDYVKFLCGQGYCATQLRLVTGDNSACSAETNGAVWDLNYPSFALSSKRRTSVTRVFHRRITNVGPASSTYKAIINAPSGLNVQVSPNVLSFQSEGQTLSFVVTIQANLGIYPISGSLVWDDGVHQVRSPIIAHAVSDGSIRCHNFLFRILISFTVFLAYVSL